MVFCGESLANDVLILERIEQQEKLNDLTV